jgi:hypothetical protein
MDTKMRRMDDLGRTSLQYQSILTQAGSAAGAWMLEK